MSSRVDQHLRHDNHKYTENNLKCIKKRKRFDLWANLAFHPSGVGKWVPASAGETKAGMVHFVRGWTLGVQVKLRSLENACHSHNASVAYWHNNTNWGYKPRAADCSRLAPREAASCLAKPSRYTWPACRYSLCCPAWQLLCICIVLIYSAAKLLLYFTNCVVKHSLLLLRISVPLPRGLWRFSHKYTLMSSSHSSLDWVSTAKSTSDKVFALLR